jgi:cytochrome c oxidase subunit 2
MLGTAFALFVAAALIIVGVFWGVARSTREPRSVDYAKATRLRGVFFLSLAAILITFLALTLRQLPYPLEARTPDRIVHAVGKQYAWSLTEGAGPTLANWDQAYSPTIDVPAGTQIEFRVTTLDVNHGFSLYAPDGHLVAQTQAMPGYLNRLRLTLDEPGTYTVLCLEFCGLGHHRMRGVVEVR